MSTATVPQRYTPCPFKDFVQSLNPSQRNLLRALLHDTEFEKELSIALGVSRGDWQKERLTNLVELGCSDGETIKRRLAELASW